MEQGQYYSTKDLANLADEPGVIVADILKFLIAYGFVKQIGKAEPLFTKSTIIISPTQSLNILKCTTRQ